MSVNNISDKKVVILMAAYNGALYIGEQIKSVINQSFTNWQLIIRDDGSNDTTLPVINSFLHDKRIQLISTATNGKGACNNFAALYSWAKKNTDPEYLMFCDQDDIWHIDKIEKTLQHIITAELRNINVPVMAYGNLQLATSSGKETGEEMQLKKQLTFNATLAQNYAFGCTIMMNKRLIELTDEIPSFAENHDYWVCLVASAFGKSIFIKDKLITYRQHTGNVTSQGAGFAKRVKRFTIDFKHQVQLLKRRLIMLKGFLRKYENKMQPQQLYMLQGYIKAFGKGRFATLAAIIKYRIYKLGFLQNAGFFYTVLTSYSKIIRL